MMRNTKKHEKKEKHIRKKWRMARTLKILENEKHTVGHEI
jgi:hypothetical protein